MVYAAVTDSSSATDSGEVGVAFQNLDIERLFVDSDEMTVMKTLQTMHLANFQLDDEMKSVMTEEIEPILLYSGNMLGMCSLIKQTQVSLNQLKTLCQAFRTCRQDVESENTLFGYDEENLANFMDKCITHYQINGSFPPSLDGEEEFDSTELLHKAVQLLGRLSMDNFRLLKRNDMLTSYKLLKVRTPAFISLVRHIIEREDAKLASTELLNAEDGPIEPPSTDHTAAIPYHGTGDIRIRGLGTVRKDSFLSFISETQSVLDYNVSKLLKNCQAAISSSNIELLIEASICLLLANEGNDQYVEQLWEARLKVTRLESSVMVVGSLSSCQKILSQLLTSVVYHMFSQRVNAEALAKLKRLLGISTADDKPERSRQQKVVNVEFSQQEYWVATFDLLKRNFERLQMDSILEYHTNLNRLIETFCESLKGCELVNSAFTELGMDVAKEFSHVEKKVVEKLEGIYREGSLASATSTVEDIEKRINSRELCVSHIKSMGKFLVRVDPKIAKEVEAKVIAMMERISQSFEVPGAPAQDKGTLDSYGEDGAVQRWLQDSGVHNVVMDMESFWPKLETQVVAILDIIAKKCIIPSTGEDRLVKTLIGSGALSSHYALLGARIFPRCIKRACLTHWIQACEELSPKEKALLTLSLRDVKPGEGTKPLTDGLKMLEKKVGKKLINEHKETYEGLRNLM